MKEYTDEEARELAEATKVASVNSPRITSAAYSDGIMSVEVGVAALGTGGNLTFFPSRCLPELENATEAELAQFRVTPSRTTILWPSLGVGVSVEALLGYAFGLRTLGAHQAKAGATRTQAKGEAARANGAKGGRPRKVMT